MLRGRAFRFRLGFWTYLDVPLLRKNDDGLLVGVTDTASHHRLYPATA